MSRPALGVTLAVCLLATGCLGFAGGSPAVSVSGSVEGADGEFTVDVRVDVAGDVDVSGLTVHLYAAEGRYACSWPARGVDPGTTTNVSIPTPTRPTYVVLASPGLAASNATIEYLVWDDEPGTLRTRRASDLAALPVSLPGGERPCRRAGPECTSSTSRESLCRVVPGSQADPIVPSDDNP